MHSMHVLPDLPQSKESSTQLVVILAIKPLADRLTCLKHADTKLQALQKSNNHDCKLLNTSHLEMNYFTPLLYLLSTGATASQLK